MGKGTKEDGILMMKMRKAQQEMHVIIELNGCNVYFSGLGNGWCALSRRK